MSSPLYLQKLADAEARNEELASTVGSATQPLMRQMDTLRSSQQQQQANWERLEAELTSRLRMLIAGSLQSTSNHSDECEQELREERDRAAHATSQLLTTQRDLAAERAKLHSVQAQLDAANERAKAWQSAQERLEQLQRQ